MTIKRWIMCSLISWLPIVSFTQQKLKLIIDPNIHYQEIDGFGASDAWRCQFVGKNWPLDKKEKIADYLFSTELDSFGNPKGIGLSIWRFYLAAGTAEQRDSSGIHDMWRRGECFLSPEGVWDWSKYEGQNWFLKAAQKRGVSKFLAFTIAPPVQYSLNGRGFADKGRLNFNIRPEKIPEYASYLAEVLSHYKKFEDVDFEYISPFNEPQWNWDNGSQEGTPALNIELFAFLKCLSNELTKRNLKTQIVLGEAASIEYLYKTVKNDGRENQLDAFFSPTSPLYIGDLPNIVPIISGHSYFSVWPVSTQINMRQELAAKIQTVNPKLGYWQSEYCVLEKNDEIGQGAKRDLGMPTALFVSRIIHNDLTICNARSWQWWTALTESDYKDGLIYLDNGAEKQEGAMGPWVESLKFDGTARDSKLLWALGNFSRFVRPGMVRVDASLNMDGGSPFIKTDVMVSAYLNVVENKIVVVGINTSNRVIPLNSISNISGSLIDTYVTSEEKSLSYAQVENGKVVIPPRSVITLSYRLK